MVNTPIGIRTVFSATSQTEAGGTLYMQNVDFSQNVQIAVAALDGSQILAGNARVDAWAQGNAYEPTYGARTTEASTTSSRQNQRLAVHDDTNGDHHSASLYERNQPFEHDQPFEYDQLPHHSTHPMFQCLHRPARQQWFR